MNILYNFNRQEESCLQKEESFQLIKEDIQCKLIIKVNKMLNLIKMFYHHVPI